MAETIRLGDVSATCEELDQMEDLYYDLCYEIKYVQGDGILEFVVDSVRQAIVITGIHMETHTTNPKIIHSV